MDEDSVKKMKESLNGSTGHSRVSGAEDKKPAKATVLQKDVSDDVPCEFWSKA